MRRTKTRRAAALLAFLLALAVLTPTLTLPVEAVKQSDIDALKEDANDLASQRKKLQERINALKSDKSKAIQQKELLDEQVDNTQAEINNVQRQIDTYTALIAQTEDELAEAERQEEAQYELFCARVRAMEERGDISYWAVLFRAESFTDMLSRLDAINELMDSDQAVIDRLQALQEELSQRWLDARVGQECEVLLENASRREATDDDSLQSWQGRDIYGALVHVPLPAGDHTGRLVNARVVEAKKHSLVAEATGQPW